MDAFLAVASKREVRRYADRPIPDDVQRRILDAGGSLTHLAREGADLDAIYHRWFRTDEETADPVTGPLVEAPS